MKHAPPKKNTSLKSKTKLRKRGKTEISKIQAKIWEHCRRIIRAKYGNVCYTCDQASLVGSNWHTGHMYPKAALGAFLKYDLRVLRPQCYYCNINLGGNGAEFYKRMVKREGKRYVDKIDKDRQKIVKAIDHYKLVLVEYENL